MKSSTWSSISDSSAYTELIARCLTIRVLIRDSIRICIRICNLMHNLTLCLPLINDNLARLVFKWRKQAQALQSVNIKWIAIKLISSSMCEKLMLFLSPTTPLTKALPINIYSPIVSAT